ncbi:MAG: hypothetical protein KA020_01965, partial [Planctomycetes bacterium]|nr:hypothetical protein [Planctomycetota bacterium]
MCAIGGTQISWRNQSLTLEDATMIHPTACVHPSAELGADVHIGVFAILEANTRIGDGCRIAAHAIVRADCELDAGVTIDSFA